MEFVKQQLDDERENCADSARMKKTVRQVEIIREREDYERELSKKPLTDAEIRDRLPEVWKRRSEAGRHQIALPIRGSSHYT